MTLLVYAQFLVIGAGILSSAIIEVSAEDEPPEEFCTPMAMAGCYVLYDDVLWDVALGPDHDGHFNNTAHHIACNAITEKSFCHKTNENCPKKAETDLTRQEKGYQLMRDLVCDFELFRDFRRALRCEDHEKMRECEPSPPKTPEQAPVNPNGRHCRYTIQGWVCREGSLQPDCYAPYKRAKEAYSKVTEAVALLTGCDYDPSVISSNVPHSVTSPVASASSAATSEAPSTEGSASAGQPSAVPPSAVPASEALSTQRPPFAGQPSAVPPSALPASGAPSSEGSSSTGHPSEAPPSLAPPSVAPVGVVLYIPTLALIRWMSTSG
ncbi:uncharacterized protein LOC144158668 [Haemaphysalis longicornis]